MRHSRAALTLVLIISAWASTVPMAACTSDTTTTAAEAKRPASETASADDGQMETDGEDDLTDEQAVANVAGEEQSADAPELADNCPAPQVGPSYLASADHGWWCEAQVTATQRCIQAWLADHVEHLTANFRTAWCSISERVAGIDWAALTAGQTGERGIQRTDATPSVTAAAGNRPTSQPASSDGGSMETDGEYDQTDEQPAANVADDEQSADAPDFADDCPQAGPSCSDSANYYGWWPEARAAAKDWIEARLSDHVEHLTTDFRDTCCSISRRIAGIDWAAFVPGRSKDRDVRQAGEMSIANVAEGNWFPQETASSDDDEMERDAEYGQSDKTPAAAAAEKDQRENAEEWADDCPTPQVRPSYLASADDGQWCAAQTTTVKRWIEARISEHVACLMANCCAAYRSISQRIAGIDWAALVGLRLKDYKAQQTTSGIGQVRR